MSGSAYPQLALGTLFLAGETLIEVKVTDAVPESVSLAVVTPTDVRLFQDRRYNDPNNIWRYLVDGLNQKEAELVSGGSWSITMAPAHVEIRRTPTNGSDQVAGVTLAHPLLRPAFCGLEGDENGFVAGTSGTGAGQTFLLRTGRLGGLWLPPDPQAEGPGLVGVGHMGVSPSEFDNSPALVLDYGEADRGLLVWELLYGAWMWRHHASDASFQAGSATYTDDPNYVVTHEHDALEALAREHRRRAPLRFWPDRDDLETWVDLEVDDVDWLTDLRRHVERQENQPALYRVQIPIKAWEEEGA